jgi:1-aminocyclopropane-1-carboxylate deaminase
VQIECSCILIFNKESQMQLTLDRIIESPIQTISHSLLKEKEITFFVKRDDLLHPLIVGNKWRKLKYNLLHMKKNQQTSLLTFSGPFSNHLYAVSMASKLFKIDCNVVIRGPNIDGNNPTIRMARACGVNLIVVDRITYRKRNEPTYQNELAMQYPHCHFIPEGGSNCFALTGVAELAKSLPKTDFLACAVGSGGTLAGLINAQTKSTQILGIPVLKNGLYLKDEIIKLNPYASTVKNWQLLTDFHDGGYGKFSDELWQFCKTMTQSHQLPLEPIYTGKLFYALWELIKNDYFPKNSSVCAIHTGGLQGLNGLRYRKLIPH